MSRKKGNKKRLNEKITLVVEILSLVGAIIKLATEIIKLLNK